MGKYLLGVLILVPIATGLQSQPVGIDLDRVGPTTIRGNGVAKLVMAGPGPALKLIGTHRGTPNPDSVQPNVWERQRAPMVDGVEINIHLKNSRGVTIVGNTLWQGYQHNLLVEGSSQIVVGTNLFDRNPVYGESQSTNGALFRDSEECTITGLHMTGTTSAPSALTLENCRWFNIKSCNILDSSERGIHLSQVDRTRISDCTTKGTRLKTARSSVIRVKKGQT